MIIRKRREKLKKAGEAEGRRRERNLIIQVLRRNCFFCKMLMGFFSKKGTAFFERKKVNNNINDMAFA